MVILKTRITDEALRTAARQVRSSMLSSLQEDDLELPPFFQEFLTSMEYLQRREEKKRSRMAAFHRCMAAILSFVFGVTLFLGLNTTARATTIHWVKSTSFGQTIFSFFEKSENTLPDYQLLWIPEKVEFVHETRTSETYAKLYYDPKDQTQGFTIECGTMDPESSLVLGHGDTEYEKKAVLINDSQGIFYISPDPTSSHCLIWFNEEANVYFTVISYLNPSVILHIAENVKLSK